MPGIQEQIAELAAKAFANHTVVQRLTGSMFRSWRCQRPGSWMYGFDVTTIPGALIVTGDLGTLVAEREADMIAWARKAAKDPHYFAGKVTSGPTREFREEKAKAWLSQILQTRCLTAEQEADLNGIVEEGTEQDICTVIVECDLADPADMPDFKDLSAQFLWQLEAIRWFLAHWSE